MGGCGFVGWRLKERKRAWKRKHTRFRHVTTTDIQRVEQSMKRRMPRNAGERAVEMEGIRSIKATKGKLEMGNITNLARL